MNSNDSFIVIMAAALMGMLVLVLVANELGKRSGLGFPGRLALVGGLGLGVFAFTIKAGLVLYLNSLQQQDIAALQSMNLNTPQEEPTTAQIEPEAPAPGFFAWRALPRSAKSPRTNATTPQKVRLGKELFFDPRLSADNNLSCASCHKLADGGDDNAQFSTGIDGQNGDRNAPTVINAAFLTRFFWDGRAGSLEAQAKGPLVNPVEMGMPSLTAVERKVRAIPAYRQAFAQVFGGANPVTIDNIAKAIAAYERTLVTPDTPYDCFVRGDESALSPQQIRGMALFQVTGCRNCHLDPTFSSAGSVKPFGVYRHFPLHADNPYIKKYDLLVNGRKQRYRVPSLRNVELTAPYFHNGSVDSLEEAIRIMAVSQLNKKLSNSSADDLLVTWPEGPVRRLTLSRNQALSDQEIRDIAAFLRSLTSRRDLQADADK